MLDIQDATILKTFLENFLKETKLIRMKYEKLEKIQATHFNVFSILDKKHDELRENKESEEINCHKKNNHQKNEIPIWEIGENKDKRNVFIDSLLQEMKEYIETLKTPNEFKGYDWRV